ncbi:MAG: hypothetical protein A2Y40_10845 [Candidatus Margulisbacteria bacterium GWF2_35_9]|nr:MAG: hypothetical protein A2Y40_10845 [Candidatus Margulisbacteria bacterium GWF2_35_9]
MGVIRTIALIVLISMLSFCEGIWKEQYSSPYSPVVASKKGDIILVLIDESHSASQKANTDLRKDSSVEGNAYLNWSQAASYINGSQSTTGKTGYSGGNNFQGKGSTDRSSRIKAQISAIIYDVKEDRYYIRGSKRIVINNEDEEISFEGVVRKTDISPENTIGSSLIADAVLKLKGYGSTSKIQEKGFITKFVDWIF